MWGPKQEKVQKPWVLRLCLYTRSPETASVPLQVVTYQCTRSLKLPVSHCRLCYLSIYTIPQTASGTLQVVLPICAHGPSATVTLRVVLSTIIGFIILLVLFVICIFPCPRLLSLLSSKGWQEIFNVRNDLNSRCVREDDRGSDESSQAWTGKKWKTVLHPVLSRSRSWALDLQSRELASQPRTPVN